jgi:CRP-like cAMP-binding protein
MPGFDLLPQRAVVELAGRLCPESYGAGSVVVQEGDLGDRCFFIIAGRAELRVTVGGSPSPLGGLEAGDYFGEIALLDPSRRRQASVVALTDLSVLSLDEQSFRAVLQSFPEIGGVLEQHTEQLLIATFMKQVAAFTTLDHNELQQLAAQVRARRFETGELIMREGEIGESCYMISSGSAEVVVRRADNERRIAVVEVGSLLGEVSLLTGSVRSASVRALEPTQVFELGKDELLQATEHDKRISRELVHLLRLRESPRRRQGIELHERLSRDLEQTTILKNPILGTYYRLSPRGRFIWDRLDGNHNLRALTMAYLRQFGAFAPQYVADLVAGLAKSGFVDVSAMTTELGRRGSSSSKWQQALMAARHAVDYQLAIGGVDRFMTAT